MSNVIQAAERFRDRASDPIDILLWQYARYWLGKTAAQVSAAHPELRNHAALEREYMQWLLRRGEEVLERC